MSIRACVPWFLALALSMELRWGQAEPTTARERYPDLDAAIAARPAIGSEGAISADRKRWVEAPAVEQLREHFQAGGLLNDEQWREALRRSRTIHLRERWPVGLPLAISVQRPHWMPLTEIYVRPQRTEFRAAEAGSFKRPFCGTCSSGRALRESYQELGSLPLGKHRLVFDVHIETDADGEESARWDSELKKHVTADVRTAWRGAVELEVEIVATVAEAMPGRHDAELDRAVRDALGLSLVAGGLQFTEPRLYEFRALSKTALSLEYELRDASSAIRSTRFLGKDTWRAGTGWRAWKVPTAAHELANWTLHVRGIDESVLRFARADHWWNGELVIPLSELARR